LIVERTLLAIATAAAVVAAVVISLVAAFFTLFALVQPHLGDAGAAAVVAAVAAAVAAVIALLAARRLEGDRRAARAQAEAPFVDPGVVGMVFNVIRERPILSAGAALAVGLYALRNPALVTTLVKGFMDNNRKS
jgi:hypothetical protein